MPSLNRRKTAYAAYSKIATFMWVSLIKRDGLPNGIRAKSKCLKTKDDYIPQGLPSCYKGQLLLCDF
ncbi:MAG: hypothetical protein DRP89_00965 [Candidatus Neomarinimicrobiota bacterium]|nr:MAG: hypothetical protein DRP89_00965 [Candidatus Neomarinimicrobiota bacterium]